jgi:hypothetical protein
MGVVVLKQLVGPQVKETDMLRWATGIEKWYSWDGMGGLKQVKWSEGDLGYS